MAVIGSGFPDKQNNRKTAFAEISGYDQSIDANMLIFHRKSKKAVLSGAVGPHGAILGLSVRGGQPEKRRIRAFSEAPRSDGAAQHADSF